MDVLILETQEERLMMSEITLHDVDKRSIMNEKAIDILVKQQDTLLKMHESQGHRLNSIDLTLRDMKNADDNFREELLELKKGFSEHKTESIPCRDQINQNKTDIGNIAESQRGQETRHSRINLAILLLMIGAFIKSIFNW